VSGEGGGLQEFNEEGEYVRQIVTIPYGNGGFSPRGVAIGPHNNVWVANNDSTQPGLVVFNETGEFLKTVVPRGSGPGQLDEDVGDIAVTPYGDVWVTDYHFENGVNSRIEEFNERGEFLRQVGSYGSGNGQFNKPYGIAVDSSGNVWVTDTENKRVEEFNEKGEYETQFGPTECPVHFLINKSEACVPKGLATDSKGDIWVTELNDIKQWIQPVAQGISLCEGPCTKESAEARLTGLAHPPAWSAGQLVHFEPASEAESAYKEPETQEGGPLLLFHKRGVGQHTPKVFAIFWGGNFETNKEGTEVLAMVLKLFGGLSSTPYQGILTQYFDEAGRISPSVAVTSYIDKRVAAPAKVNRVKVEEEIKSAIEVNRWPIEENAQFVVVTAPGSEYEGGFPGACAYHTITPSGLVYDFVPYQGDPQFVANGCVETGNPSGNPVRKTSKSASHEYAETATDPLLNAWYSPRGGEIGDLCQSEPDVELPDGAWVQNLYDDYLDGCTHEDVNPPHVWAVTQRASGVRSSRAKLHGILNAEGLETHYHFEYGPTTSYGTGTAELAASTTRNIKARVAIKGLQPGTTYHYRLVATNATGSMRGRDQTFKT
jgi:streptogramin lyase